PRLAYADWLEEHGQRERGQFIRLHVAWCRRPADAPEDEELKRSLIAAWRAARLPKKPLPKGGYVYDRGFIAGVSFNGSEPFREHLEEALARAPTIRVLSVWPAYEEHLAWLAESPLLARLTGLSCPITDEEVASFVASPHFEGMRFIDWDLEDDALEMARLLASAKRLRQLTVLDFERCHFGDEGMEALASASHLRTLRKLDAGSFDGSHELGEAGIRALTSSRYLKQLTHLNFSGSAINGAALRRLLRWGGAARLLE